MVRSSGSTYDSLGISVKEPSVVTTIPIVECSEITLPVPISAARLNGIVLSDHGVFTRRSLSFSYTPRAPFTINPTQSIRRTFTFTPSTGHITGATPGINFGSVVVIVLPEPLCGSSSIVRFLTFSFSIAGMTQRSINRFINVDFPVLTGPTTPRKISPLVLICISL